MPMKKVKVPGLDTVINVPDDMSDVQFRRVVGERFPDLVEKGTITMPTAQERIDAGDFEVQPSQDKVPHVQPEQPIPGAEFGHPAMKQPGFIDREVGGVFSSTLPGTPERAASGVGRFPVPYPLYSEGRAAVVAAKAEQFLKTGRQPAPTPLKDALAERVDALRAEQAEEAAAVVPEPEPEEEPDLRNIISRKQFEEERLAKTTTSGRLQTEAEAKRAVHRGNLPPIVTGDLPPSVNRKDFFLGVKLPEGVVIPGLGEEEKDPDAPNILEEIMFGWLKDFEKSLDSKHIDRQAAVEAAILVNQDENNLTSGEMIEMQRQGIPIPGEITANSLLREHFGEGGLSGAQVHGQGVAGPDFIGTSEQVEAKRDQNIRDFFTKPLPEGRMRTGDEVFGPMNSFEKWVGEHKDGAGIKALVATALMQKGQWAAGWQEIPYANADGTFDHRIQAYVPSLSGPAEYLKGGALGMVLTGKVPTYEPRGWFEEQMVNLAGLAAALPEFVAGSAAVGVVTENPIAGIMGGMALASLIDTALREIIERDGRFPDDPNEIGEHAFRAVKAGLEGGASGFVFATTAGLSGAAISGISAKALILSPKWAAKTGQLAGGGLGFAVSEKTPEVLETGDISRFAISTEDFVDGVIAMGAIHVATAGKSKLLRDLHHADEMEVLLAHMMATQGTDVYKAVKKIRDDGLPNWPIMPSQSSRGMRAPDLASPGDARMARTKARELDLGDVKIPPTGPVVPGIRKMGQSEPSKVSEPAPAAPVAAPKERFEGLSFKERNEAQKSEFKDTLLSPSDSRGFGEEVRLALTNKTVAKNFERFLIEEMELFEQTGQNGIAEVAALLGSLRGARHKVDPIITEYVASITPDSTSGMGQVRFRSGVRRTKILGTGLRVIRDLSERRGTSTPEPTSAPAPRPAPIPNRPGRWQVTLNGEALPAEFFGPFAEQRAMARAKETAERVLEQRDFMQRDIRQSGQTIDAEGILRESAALAAGEAPGLAPEAFPAARKFVIIEAARIGRRRLAETLSGLDTALNDFILQGKERTADNMEAGIRKLENNSGMAARVGIEILRATAEIADALKVLMKEEPKNIKEITSLRERLEALFKLRDLMTVASENAPMVPLNPNMDVEGLGLIELRHVAKQYRLPATGNAEMLANRITRARDAAGNRLIDLPPEGERARTPEELVVGVLNAAGRAVGGTKEKQAAALEATRLLLEDVKVFIAGDDAGSKAGLIKMAKETKDPVALKAAVDYMLNQNVGDAARRKAETVMSEIYGDVPENLRPVIDVVVMLQGIVSLGKRAPTIVTNTALTFKSAKETLSLMEKGQLNAYKELLEKLISEGDSRVVDIANDSIARQLVDLTPQQVKMVNERAARVFKFYRDRLRQLADSGIISNAEATRLAEQGDYTPREILKKMDELETGLGYRPVLTSTERNRLRKGGNELAEYDLYVDIADQVTQVLYRTEGLVLGNNTTRSLAEWVRRPGSEPYKLELVDKVMIPGKGLEFKSPGSGRALIKYWENGIEKGIIGPTEFLKSWRQNRISGEERRMLDRISRYSGADMVRFFATGAGNPGFFMQNLGPDFIHSILSTDIFGFQPFRVESMNVLGREVKLSIPGEMLNQKLRKIPIIGEKMAVRFAVDSQSFNIPGTTILPSAVNLLHYTFKNMQDSLAREPGGAAKIYIETNGSSFFLSAERIPNVEFNIVRKGGIFRVVPTKKLSKEQTVEFLSYLNGRSELLFRATYVDAMLDTLAKKRGVSREVLEADFPQDVRLAVAAADSRIKFSDGGAWLRRMDAFIPYTKANVNALRGGLRTLRDNPMQFFSQMMDASAMFGMMYMMNTTEENKADYLGLNSRVKNDLNFFNVPFITGFEDIIRFRDGTAMKPYLRSPMPSDLAMLNAVTSNMMARLTGRTEPDGEQMLDAISQFTRTGTSTLLPPLLEAYLTFNLGIDPSTGRFAFRGDRRVQGAAAIEIGKTPQAFEIASKFGGAITGSEFNPARAHLALTGAVPQSGLVKGGGALINAAAGVAGWMMGIEFSKVEGPERKRNIIEWMRFIVPSFIGMTNKNALLGKYRAKFGEEDATQNRKLDNELQTTLVSATNVMSGWDLSTPEGREGASIVVDEILQPGLTAFGQKHPSEKARMQRLSKVWAAGVLLDMKAPGEKNAMLALLSDPGFVAGQAFELYRQTLPKERGQAFSDNVESAINVLGKTDPWYLEFKKGQLEQEVIQSDPEKAAIIRGLTALPLRTLFIGEAVAQELRRPEIEVSRDAMRSLETPGSPRSALPRVHR
jgi:hypothetical protein